MTDRSGRCRFKPEPVECGVGPKERQRLADAPKAETGDAYGFSAQRQLEDNLTKSRSIDECI
jgi:hypothetical protein